jgi:hypothetical protein
MSSPRQALGAVLLALATASAIAALVLPWTQYGDGPSDFLGSTNYARAGWMRATGLLVMAGTAGLVAAGPVTLLLPRSRAWLLLAAAAAFALALPVWTTSEWGTFPAALAWTVVAALLSLASAATARTSPPG